ncbi:NfeD family protein [Klebsiella pneumoniae subsp. pneumoniae]
MFVFTLIILFVLFILYKLMLIVPMRESLTLWFMSAIVLLLAFRQVTQKLVGGDSHVDNTDEELDIYNQIARVKQTIGPGQSTGRVEFQGERMAALGDGSVIAAALRSGLSAVKTLP